MTIYSSKTKLIYIAAGIIVNCRSQVVQTVNQQVKIINHIRIIALDQEVEITSQEVEIK